MGNMRIAIWIVVLAMLSSASVSWGGAKTVEYKGTHCYTGDTKSIKFSKDHWAFSYDLVGTVTPRDERGMEGILSSHCVGTGVFNTGTITVDVVCEFVDKDGDKKYGKGKRIGPNGEFTFIAGTGKWEGITGVGTYKPAGKYPKIVPGKFQGCFLTEGSYTLPE